MQALDYAYGLVTEYGDASAELAAEYYDTVVEMEGLNLRPALPADTATWDETAKAIQGTWNWTDDYATIAGTVERLVKMAGEDTTIKNAQRDSGQFAWIPNGAETCAFCLAIASRGWQDADASTLKGNHADHIHPHCDCEFAIRHTGDVKYIFYNPNYYKNIYDNAEGKSSYEKINSIRRMQYRERNGQ